MSSSGCGVESLSKDVAAMQVPAGMAWFYVKYGKGYEQLRDIEQAARQAGRPDGDSGRSLPSPCGSGGAQAHKLLPRSR